MLDNKDPASEGRPPGFEDEEMSVIVVMPKEHQTTENFRQSYRRLFSNLNRYAKPTDADTNIIMDEDDLIAILTRRLISDHDFFRYDGNHKDSPRIKTKGKNLKSGESFFTSLQTLYAMNLRLLTTEDRKNQGWSGENDDFFTFKQFRPAEEHIERYYSELVLYWDGILGTLPVLRQDPCFMRTHEIDHYFDKSDTSDNLLFWPIGQEMLAKIVRRLLNTLENDEPTESNVGAALSGLSSLDWRLHAPPWRHLLLTKSHDGNKVSWKMRSESRKEAVAMGEELLVWQTLRREDELPEALKIRWASLLTPSPTQEDEDEYWDYFVATRAGAGAAR